MKRLGLISAAIAAFALVACGDDSGGGSPDAAVNNPDAPSNPADSGTPADAGDISSDFGNAKPITVGDPNGEGDAIGAPGDHDFYSFTANAGDWLQVKTIANAGDDPTKVDTVIRLYDANMQQIAEDDDAVPRLSTDSEIIFHAPATGTYYVEVLEWSEWSNTPPFEGNATYTYQVAVVTPPDVVAEPATDPGDNAASAMTVATIGARGTVLEGLFKDVADTDVYKVTVPAVMGMATTNFAAALAPSGPMGYGSTAPTGVAMITDLAGTTTYAKLDTAVATGAASLQPPIAPGTYLVWISRGTGAGGANPYYVGKVNAFGGDNPLEAETPGMTQNDTLATAQALAMADDGAGGQQGFILAHLSTNTDVDYFSFPVVAGALHLTIACGSAREGSGVQGLKFDFRNASDGVLASKTETLAADAVIQGVSAPAAGTFYLRLSKTGQDPTVTGDWIRCGVHLSPM
jgi:hypothetical protein